MLKTLKIGFLIFALSGVITSCSSSVEGTDPSIEGAPFVSRLIFTGISNVADAKIEIDEAYVESVLDGNPEWEDIPFSSSPTYTTEYPSAVAITISNFEYDAETVESITCASDRNNKMNLIYTSELGDLSKGPDDKFYRHIFSITPPVDFYMDQEDNELILSARVQDFFLAQNCSGSDGKVYEVSFYPSTDVLAHNLDTTFTIADGSISGIIRVHQEGNGYVPFVDMLFY